jgi:hypothetical protein
VCAAGNECRSGSCQCAEGQESCGSYCADLNHDADNCGACGVQCGSCETCVDGACLDTGCGDGGVCCNSTCVPACEAGQTLDLHTCQCGEQCSGGCDECQQCVNGQCQPAPDGTPCFSGDNLCCGGQCGDSTACGYAQHAPNGPFVPSYCCSAGMECTPYGLNSDTCCPTDNNGITPDGQCCPPGSDPVSCTFPDGHVTYECCTYPAQGMNECNCCGGCCALDSCQPHIL